MKTKNTMKTTAIKPKKEKKEKIMGPLALNYELISFSVKATIPVMAYGNIIPEIVVKTRTIEEAEQVVLPVIEKLFEFYSENKSSVTVKEKQVVVPLKPTPVENKKPTGVLTQAAAVAPVTPKAAVEELAQELSPKSPAFLKANSAINSATSLEALGLIEEQVQKSVKLSPEEKPLLSVEILKKRKEL